MPSFEQTINQRVQAFVTEITELAKRQAFETLTAALGAAVSPGRGRGAARNGAARVRAVASSGGRRSPDQIESTCQALMAAVESSPGQRIEQIGQTIGMRTKDLALPMRKLIKERQVKTQGHRRATRYFPGAGGASAPRRGRRRGGGRRKAAAAAAE